MQIRKIRNPIHHSPSNRSNPSSPTHPYPHPSVQFNGVLAAAQSSPL